MLEMLTDVFDVDVEVDESSLFEYRLGDTDH